MNQEGSTRLQEALSMLIISHIHQEIILTRLVHSDDENKKLALRNLDEAKSSLRVILCELVRS